MIIKKALGVLLSLTFISGLSACGGGGGGGDAQGSAVVSTSPFNIFQAYVNDLTTSTVRPVTVSGRINGYAVTGSGTTTPSPLVGETYLWGGQFVQVLQRTETMLANVTANGLTFPLNTTVAMYTDLNYAPLAVGTSGEFDVIVGTPTLPTAAHVNDTGIAYDFDRFKDSTRADYLGTGQAIYVLEADTATTAIVKFVTTYKDALKNIVSVSTSQYRINTSNTYAYISASSTDYTSGNIINYNFIF